VIFNTKEDGLPKVAAARLPDGLLAELDKNLKKFRMPCLYLG
jgi:hypothetical protein